MSWIEKLILDFKPREGIAGITFPLIDVLTMEVERQAERKNRLKNAFPEEIELDAFHEALKAFEYGLFRSTIVLSSGSLEYTLKRILKQLHKKGIFKVSKEIENMNLAKNIILELFT